MDGQATRPNTNDARTPGVAVALGLGANLGDPERTIRQALEALQAAGLAQVRLSRFHCTAPVDCVPDTPEFTNAAATGCWPGSPCELLAVCRRTERALGRPARHSSRESRLIDIDVLLWGTDCVTEPGLIVPHPRLTERLFVLVPLADIAPDWAVPPTMRTVTEWHRDLCRRHGTPAGRVRRHGAGNGR